MKITLLKIYVLKTWIEDDLFNDGDNPDIAHVSKDILKDIKENDPYLDLNIPTSAIIDDLFEPSDDENNDVTLRTCLSLQTKNLKLS